MVNTKGFFYPSVFKMYEWSLEYHSYYHLLSGERKAEYSTVLSRGHNWKASLPKFTVMTENTKLQHLQDGISPGAHEAGGAAGVSRHDLVAFNDLNEVSTSKCELLKDLASKDSVNLRHTDSPGQASSVIGDLVQGLPQWLA